MLAFYQGCPAGTGAWEVSFPVRPSGGPCEANVLRPLRLSSSKTRKVTLSIFATPRPPASRPRFIMGVGGTGQPLIRLRRLHMSGCPTSKLYGEARPKPPTLGRRAPKNTKNPSLCWGKAFWTEFGLDGIWVAHKRLQEHSLPHFEGT